MTLLEQNQVIEATIGSGCAYSIEDWLNEFFKLINKDWKCYLRKRENLKAEYQLLVSNPATINSLGWYPDTTLTELAAIMMR